jgi:hypothetical protein
VRKQIVIKPRHPIGDKDVLRLHPLAVVTIPGEVCGRSPRTGRLARVLCPASAGDDAFIPPHACSTPPAHDE